MFLISSNLIKLNDKPSPNMTAASLLKRLGFTLNEAGDVICNATPPTGWTHKPQGRWHDVFYGPNGEIVQSFVNLDFWYTQSTLQAWKISEDALIDGGGK